MRVTSLPLLLSILPILLAGCAATVRSPSEGPVRLGQIAFAGGPRVRPIRVVEDSRCPENARCVWSGRVVVRSEILTGAGTRTADLTLGEWTPVADGRLALVSVAPERRTGRPLRPRKYRFIFQFQGGL